jgi:hypothetical protein
LQLITPVTQLPPLVVRVHIFDSTAVDTSTITLNMTWPFVFPDSSNSAPGDSFQWDDHPKHIGWYYFHVPDTLFGRRVVAGDTIWFFCDGSDTLGNYGTTGDQYVVVGSVYQGIGRIPDASVRSFALHANYPNPFNPTTQIAFDLPAEFRVTLKVYNTLGQQVATLVDGEMLAQGRHQLTFDGRALPSGMYFYTVQAGPYNAVQKMVLLK